MKEPKKSKEWFIWMSLGFICLGVEIFFLVYSEVFYAVIWLFIFLVISFFVAFIRELRITKKLQKLADEELKNLKCPQCGNKIIKTQNWSLWIEYQLYGENPRGAHFYAICHSCNAKLECWGDKEKALVSEERWKKEINSHKVKKLIRE